MLSCIAELQRSAAKGRTANAQFSSYARFVILYSLDLPPALHCYFTKACRFCHQFQRRPHCMQMGMLAALCFAHKQLMFVYNYAYMRHDTSSSNAPLE